MIARYRDGRVAPAPAGRGARCRARTACAPSVRRALRRLGPHRARSKRSGSSSAGSTATSSDRAVAAREGRGAGRRARRGALRPRRRPARGGGRAVAVPARDGAARSSRRCGQPADLAWERVALRRTPETDGHRAGGAALPAGRPADRRGVIDTHAHLDACADPADELVARARAGRRRADRHGRHGHRLVPRRRSRSPRRHDGVVRRARHPSARGGRRGRRPARRAARAARARRAPSRWGRPGSTTTATTRRTTAQRALFELQLELAAELGKPVVVHTRAAGTRRAAALAPLRRHGRPALLLVRPSCCRSRSSAATTSRSPAT